MNFQFLKLKNKGQALVELILVMGLAAIILPALLTGFVASRNGKPQQVQRNRGTALLKETEKGIRNVQNTNWSSFATNGTYHTAINGTLWNLVSGALTNTDGITQRIDVADVYRDSSGAIATAGTVDPSTKKALITISWTMPSASSITSTMYLTHTKNSTVVQTTQSDFNAGIPTRTVVAATGASVTDGQVQLATTGSSGSTGTSGAVGDWCKPNLSITALDLPKSGVANAISAIQGRVFAGTGNNSSGVSFANVNVTDTHPPNSSVAGTFNGYKTNAVFGETNYGYLATDTNSKEIVIMDFTTNPYSQVGYFDAPGNGSGNSVFVSGNIGYMTAGNKLYTFDLSSKTGSRSQLGSIVLDGVGNKIFVRGSYVYVAIGSTTNQLEIVQVSSTGTILTKKSSFSVNGQAAQDVYVDTSGTRSYLATASSATQKEMFIVDVSNKSAAALVSSYEANGMNPKGITVATYNKAILVGSGGEEYQVIDISTEESPVRCGGLNIDTGVNGVSSVEETDGDAYSYIITGDSSSELKIIEGGGGTALQANWCSPQNSIVNTLTLPKQPNIITSQLGKAFIGTGDGIAGVSFVNVGITTPPSSVNPSASVTSTYSDSSQTNGLYSDGSYAYVAVNGSASQIAILNIASTPYTKVGSINIPSGANANGVYVSNNIAYVTSNNTLYTYDVTTKTGVHSTVLAQSDLYSGNGATPTAKQVTVVGSKAYVSASGTAYGLQVFTVGTGGTSLRLVGVSNLSWVQSAQGLVVNPAGTRGYVAFNNGTGTPSKGFFIVDTSPVDPAAWWPIPNFYDIVGAYDSGNTDPTGLAISPGAGNRAMLSGNNGTYQYHVVDISLDSDPLLCGGLAIASGIRGVSTLQDQYGRGYTYIATSESANNFKIIQGGSGGGSYSEDGIFESSIIDLGTNAVFNRLSATVIKPTQATIRLQVASAPAVSNSCSGATYNYVGPDGSDTSFYIPNGSSISDQIPFSTTGTSYLNPARCFRYKTWFTTWDTSQTPVFNDITVNYTQ